MKISFVGIFISLCVIVLIQSNNDFPFQKKIWTYWHEEDLSSAPMLVRQCSEHIKQAAQSMGFEYFRLNQKTVKNYITNFEQKITKVREKSKQGGLAAEADLIRFNLLYENGGIWMDITTFFPEGIDWLVNIKSKKYRNIITNRFSQDPEVMLVYFQGYQNTQEYRIADPKNQGQYILYNEMPGYEAWFFAAKKHSQLINDIRVTYTRFTQLQFKQMVEIFHNEDIYMNNVDFGSYLTVDMAACYTLQKKQLQLDQQKPLFADRPNVYEYYNLWSLSAILGPLFWTQNENWAVNHMIELNKQQYEKEGNMINLFVKNLGWFSSRMWNQMHRSQQLFYEQKLTFQKFLQSNPNEWQCQETTFLAEDSLLYNILKNSTEVASGKIKVITKQQKRQWHQYCKKYEQEYNFNEWVDEILFKKIRPIDGTTYRAHEIVDFDKRSIQTYKENLNDFFFERKANISFFFKFFTHFFSANTVQITLILVFQFLWKKFRKDSQITIQNHLTTKEKLSNLYGFFAIVFIGTLSFYKYFMIDFFGFRDDPEMIILILIIVYYLQNFIQQRTEKSRALKTLYDLSYLFVSYCTTYLTFCLTRRYKVLLFYCTVIVGLLGPCLMKLYDNLRAYKEINNPYLSYLRYLSDCNAFRIGSVSLILTLYFLPSLRYFAISEHYVVSFIPIILSIFVILAYIVLLYECIKTQVKREILNLLILGVFTWQLYDLFYDRNKDIDQNQRRNAWNMIVISLFSMIYLQVGSTYLMLANKFRLSEKNEQKWFIRLLKNVLQLAIFFSGFALQVYNGYFPHMTWIPYNLRQWFTQILYLSIYCFFIGVYVNFKNQSNQQELDSKRIQPIKEMEEFSMIGSEIGVGNK